MGVPARSPVSSQGVCIRRLREGRLGHALEAKQPPPFATPTPTLRRVRRRAVCRFHHRPRRRPPLPGCGLGGPDVAHRRPPLRRCGAPRARGVGPRCAGAVRHAGARGARLPSGPLKPRPSARACTGQQCSRSLAGSMRCRDRPHNAQSTPSPTATPPPPPRRRCLLCRATLTPPRAARACFTAATAASWGSSCWAPRFWRPGAWPGRCCCSSRSGKRASCACARPTKALVRWGGKEWRRPVQSKCAPRPG